MQWRLFAKKYLKWTPGSPFWMALGSLWAHFWHMKVTFGAFRGHFEVTLSISTSNFMCDACVMHTCTGLVGPKTGKVKNVFVLKAFFKVSRYPRGDSENEQVSEPSHFWVTLGPLWCHFGYIRVTLGHFMITLWSLWSYFGCNKVGFQQTLIFPIEFKYF